MLKINKEDTLAKVYYSNIVCNSGSKHLIMNILHEECRQCMLIGLQSTAYVTFALR